MTLRSVVIFGLFLFLVAGILFPNPYGNNPDIVGDESYFLSTALFSIEKMTLPGWEFSPSGAYYGGPQTYIDTLVLVPVLGAVVAASDFSVMAAKIWVAINTGELLHILRLVNGIAALGTILFFFFYFRKRDIPRPLALTLTLFLFLLLSNVLVIEFLHTAKMWVFYIIFVAAMSALFIVQEYYLSGAAAEPFIKKNTYVALFMWSGVLIFFQSWVGAFSIALLVLYALLLRHFNIRDLWNYFLKYWWLFGLFSATQVGFLWRLYSIREIFEEITANTDLFSPLSFAFASHPLIVLYPGALLVIGGMVYRNRALLADSRKRMWLMIAAMHPVLVFLIFHVGFGFDIGPRYAIFLTMAASFSTVALLSEVGKRAVLAGLFFSFVLFAVINTHAIQLYSRQSSEVDLQNIIIEKYNSSENVFINDNSAKRLTLPINYESLPDQGQTRLAMGRYGFLLENRELLSKEPEFKPLAFTTYTKEEEDSYIQRFEKTHSVWMVRRHCENRCTVAETEAGTCFELHLEACVISPQDVNALPEFLSSQQLGNSYIVRKVN